LHPEAPRSAVGSSALFRRKRRGKALDVVSAAIPGGVAAGNDRDHPTEICEALTLKKHTT